MMDSLKRVEEDKMRLHLISLYLSLFDVWIRVPHPFDVLQMPLPPGVYQRLTSSSTLLNLAQALAYHKTYVFSSPIVFSC